jgi:hypothetical protein
MIDITGVDLVKFAQKAYELSMPQGLGFLRFTPDPLSEDDAKKIVECSCRPGRIKLNMDYVSGRACKMIVWEKNGRLIIDDSWYDHTDEQLIELLDEFGIVHTKLAKHGCACNCVTCRANHGKPADL